MRAAQAAAGSGSPPTIEVRDLSRGFRAGLLSQRVEAVRGVSFVVAPGEVVGLLGPNGSGKTTLLDVLIGFCRPDRGHVAVLGEPAGSRSALRRIGHQPQTGQPYANLGARAFLRFLASARGMPRATGRSRVEELLERLELRGAAHRPMAGYSTGMLRRLGFAQALLHRPELLLLDEPTSGLDPQGSAVVREMLVAEAARGVTILMASHHLHEVERLCQRVLMLVDGRLAADGPLRSLCADHDRLTLAARGLDAAGWEAVQQRVCELGGTILDAGPGQLDLEVVYRRLLEQSATP